LSLLMTLAMTGGILGVVGEARSIHKRFKFIVEIDGVASAGFQSCSGLEAELAEMTYWEGGAIIPEKQPTRLTVSDVTLERGAATGDHDLWNWFSQTADASANAGLPSPLFKRNLDIVQMNHDNSVIRRWTIFNAWPKKFVAGEWDNTSDDPTMEQVVLAIDYFEKTYEAAA
jgi:phage tail-like protein